MCVLSSTYFRWATGLSVCAIAIDSGTVARTFIGQGLRVGIAAYVPALALALAGLGLPYIVLPRILKSDSLTVWPHAVSARKARLYHRCRCAGDGLGRSPVRARV